MATGMDIFEFGMHYQVFVRKYSDGDWSVAIFNLFQILDDDQWFHFCNHVHSELSEMNVPKHKDVHRIRDLDIPHRYGTKPAMKEVGRFDVYCRALELAFGRYDSQKYIDEKYQLQRGEEYPENVLRTQHMLGALVHMMPRKELEGFVNLMIDKEYGPWASHYYKQEEEA